jgi:hypothetical protein
MIRRSDAGDVSIGWETYLHCAFPIDQLDVKVTVGIAPYRMDIIPMIAPAVPDWLANPDPGFIGGARIVQLTSDIPVTNEERVLAQWPIIDVEASINWENRINLVGVPPVVPPPAVLRGNEGRLFTWKAPQPATSSFVFPETKKLTLNGTYSFQVTQVGDIPIPDTMDHYCISTELTCIQFVPGPFYYLTNQPNPAPRQIMYDGKPVIIASAPEGEAKRKKKISQ